jgi:hypothetical protein
MDEEPLADSDPPLLADSALASGLTSGVIPQLNVTLGGWQRPVAGADSVGGG